MPHCPLVPGRPTRSPSPRELIDENPTGGLSATVFYRDDANTGGVSSRQPRCSTTAAARRRRGGRRRLGAAASRRSRTTPSSSSTSGDRPRRTRPHLARPDRRHRRQRANALYQVDDSPAFTAGGQPIFKIIMTEAERAELDGHRRRRSAERPVQRPDERHVRQHRRRRSATCATSPASQPRRGRARATSTTTASTSPTTTPGTAWRASTSTPIYSASEVAAVGAARAAGVYAQHVDRRPRFASTTPTSPRADIDMFGSYSLVEVENNDFVENHFPTDDQGNYYRGVDGSHECAPELPRHDAAGLLRPPTRSRPTSRQTTTPT